MQAERIPNAESRWIQLGLVAFVIIALLAVATYVWGSWWNADRQQGAGMSSGVTRVKSPVPGVARVKSPVPAVARVKSPVPAVNRFLSGSGTL
jgi:hypothetical protein